MPSADRFCSVCSSASSYQDAQFVINELNGTGGGVIIGTGIGGIKGVRRATDGLPESGSGPLPKPFMVPMMIASTWLGLIQFTGAAKGTNSCPVPVLPDPNAVGMPFSDSAGIYQTMICSGASSGHAIVRAGFAAARTLSRRIDDHEQPAIL